MHITCDHQRPMTLALHVQNFGNCLLESMTSSGIYDVEDGGAPFFKVHIRFTTAAIGQVELKQSSLGLAHKGPELLLHI